MTSDMVQVMIYDAPSAKTSGCGCGCGGHHQHGEADDSLAAVSLEMQEIGRASCRERV